MSVWVRQLAKALFWLAFLAVGAGCGPIAYTHQVTRNAATAVEQARKVQADRLAEYEYTAALEYLHKAREEAGYSDYEAALRFGRIAEKMAIKARELAVARAAGEPETEPQGDTRRDERREEPGRDRDDDEPPPARSRATSGDER